MISRFRGDCRALGAGLVEPFLEISLAPPVHDEIEDKKGEKYGGDPNGHPQKKAFARVWQMKLCLRVSGQVVHTLIGVFDSDRAIFPDIVHAAQP